MMHNCRLFIFSLIILLVGCGINDSEENSVKDNKVSFSENDYEKIVLSSNKLGFELIREVERDENDNAFISPASLYKIGRASCREIEEIVDRCRDSETNKSTIQMKYVH